jgi:hypothetical protein
MTSQMSFNPAAVTRWVGEVRDAGITLPLHLGVPGVADLPKLMKVAARIGVADSARYLKKNKQLLGHLVRGGSFGPDAFLERLAPMLADPVADVRVLHVFTFNQVEQTAAWQRGMPRSRRARSAAEPSRRFAIHRSRRDLGHRPSSSSAPAAGRPADVRRGAHCRVRRWGRSG